MTFSDTFNYQTKHFSIVTKWLIESKVTPYCYKNKSHVDTMPSLLSIEPTYSCCEESHS